MRIVHLIDRPALGGAERLATQLAQRQTAAGHDASVMHLSSFRFTRTLDPRGLLDLTNALNAHPPDILHTHLWGPSLVGRLTGRVAGVPVVCTWHAAPYHWGPLSDARKKLRFLSERITAGTARFTATSQAVRDAWVHATGLHNRDVTIVHNGVDTDVFTPNPSAIGGRTALCVGNLVVAKGHDTLVHAAALAADDILWLCAGDGEERPRIQNLMARLSVLDRIQLMGRRDDIADIMSRSDVLVLPSRSEGLPLALLEAMACGLPVIATDVGGISEVITSGENGILIPPDDPQKLANVVDALLDDPQRGADLAAAARTTVETHFTLAQTAAGYLSVYEESLKDRKN